MSSRTLSQVEEDDLSNLIDQIRSGQCAAFIGSGMSAEAGSPSASEIAGHLATEIGRQRTDTSDLAKVAMKYERARSREALISTISSLFQGRSAPREVTSFDLMAALDVFPYVVTTNWDNLIEDAFGEKGKSLSVVNCDEKVTSFHESPRVLIKFHGDFTTPPKQMIITTGDYIDRYNEVNQVGGMYGLLASWLGTKTVLFVGYSLSDSDFDYLFKLVKTRTSQASVRHYAIVREMEDSERESWHHDGIRVIQLEAASFFKRLFVELRQFANRTQEIEYICNQAKKPFVEVIGFTDRGKTELLKQAQKLYRLKRPSWSICHMSVADKNGFEVLDAISRGILKQSIDRESLVRQAQDAARESGPRENPLVVDPDETERAALNLGTEQLAQRVRFHQILLIFDDLDRVTDSMFSWLEGQLLKLLWTQHAEPEMKLRVLLADQNAPPWRERFFIDNRYQFSLNPFDKVAIADMLRATVGLTIKTPLGRDKVDTMVERILWLSGGHPIAIRRLLHHLADRKFDIPLDDPDYFLQNRATLFKELVYPAVERRVEQVAAESHPLLDALAIFRCFNITILKDLMQFDGAAATTRSAKDVLRELSRAGLVWRPLSAAMDTLDYTVRHILAERMEIYQPERYVQLHELGARIFDRWVVGTKGTPTDYQWPVYMLESLFHHSNLVQLGQEKPEQLLALCEKTIAGVMNPDPVRQRGLTALRQLKGLLNEDSDLARTMTTALGEKGTKKILEGVDRGVAELNSA